MNSQYLFSYGTLLPEHAPAEIASIAARFQPVGAAWIPGVLYDFGDYPGAVMDRSAKSRIQGVIFRLPDSDVLRQLDEYEEFNPESSGESLFVRKLCFATLNNAATNNAATLNKSTSRGGRSGIGRKMRCWVYVYNREPGTAPIVASGRYSAMPRRMV